MEKKEYLDGLCKVIMNHFNGLEQYLQPEIEDRLALGIAGNYLRSILELYHSVIIALDSNFPETAGVIGASLWERSLTLRHILSNSQKHVQVFIEHKKVKTVPWKIWEMVRSIESRENVPKHRDHIIQQHLLYFQYTLLSTIKHGNPFTISYLHRMEKNPEKTTIALVPNISLEDQDLIHFLRILCTTVAFDALMAFGNKFFIAEHLAVLRRENQHITAAILELHLQVPQLFITSEEELTTPFWEHVKKLSEHFE